MTSVLVVVAASAPPLVGASRPVAFERFCGERLLERTLALAAHVIGDVRPIIASTHPLDAPEGTFHQTSTTDLFTLLREVAGRAAPGTVGLAVDSRHPMLSAATLLDLVAAARKGQTIAVGRSPAELAALAMPLLTVPEVGDAVTLVTAPDRELARVACKKTLVEIERRAFVERAEELLTAGLLIRDPATIRIDGPITFGADVEIEPGCTLHGPNVLGDRVRIGKSCILTRATIGDDTEIRPFTIIEDASIAERGFIGPYARIRPGTSVGPQAQIGNFVELKAARLGRGNRINHLSFVGDASLADQVTIGAGTITCNHDGVGIQPTTIGEGVYVGSGCVLVAPITIGDGATVGAGSTLTEDAPPSKLTLARTRQVVVEGGWRRREANRK